MMRCWAALLLAVAAASKQKENAPHDAKKKDPTGGASLVHAPKKPVAVCVSGLARAFYAVPRVQRNAFFALCDKDADGQLELWELSDLISDASDDMNELGDHIKARIPTFDDGGGFVEMVEFEALLKSDAHLYLNFYWTWVPFIGGNLLAGLELFEQVAIAVGVLPNFELALRMCPAFSAAAGLATAGDWKIGALELAQVLFGALGVPVPAGESFRALQPAEGDGVPAKDDGATPRAAERVGAADGAETPSMAPTKSKDMHFFATPVLTGAQTAPLMFKLSKAVTLVFDELLGAYKRRAAHAAKANPKPGDVPGAPGRLN